MPPNKSCRTFRDIKCPEHLSHVAVLRPRHDERRSGWIDFVVFELAVYPFNLFLAAFLRPVKEIAEPRSHLSSSIRIVSEASAPKNQIVKVNHRLFLCDLHKVLPPRSVICVRLPVVTERPHRWPLCLLPLPENLHSFIRY